MGENRTSLSVCLDSASLPELTDAELQRLHDRDAVFGDVGCVQRSVQYTIEEEPEDEANGDEENRTSLSVCLDSASLPELTDAELQRLHDRDAVFGDLGCVQRSVQYTIEEEREDEANNEVENSTNESENVNHNPLRSPPLQADGKCLAGLQNLGVL